MKTPEFLLRKSHPTDGMAESIAHFRYPPRPRLLMWPSVLGLVAAVAVGLLALRLTVTSAGASPLARIALAERNAPRCVVRFCEGDRRLWGVGWQEGRKARFDLMSNGAPISSRGSDGQRTWSVNSDSHSAFIVTDPNPIVAPLDTKIADYEGKVSVRSSRLENGMRTVVVERRASATSFLQRDTIEADSQDRPRTVKHEYFRQGHWTLGSVEVREYDRPIPDETFAFQPPKGYEVYDIDANRARLIEGLRHGPSRTVEGIKVRLAGVLQDRHGTLTAVYCGGSTPRAGAKGFVRQENETYPGWAVTGTAPDPRAGQPLGRGAFRWPTRIVRTRKGQRVVATPEPFARIDGKDVRLIRFYLPKAKNNASRTIRLALPAVDAQGTAKGAATFEVSTIPSLGGEEIYRLPSAKRSAYEIPLDR